MATASTTKSANAAGKLNPDPAPVGALESETAREQAPGNPSENNLIRKALAAAGFTMTGDPIWLGGNWFAGIHSSTTISTTGSRRIRKSLGAAGFSVTGDPIQLGGKHFVGIHPRSWNEDAPVVNPSLGPQVTVAAAVERNGKSLETAGFHLPESIQMGGNQFVVLRPQKIVFVPSPGGWSVVQSTVSPAVLLNTYESIVKTLGQALVVVRQNCDIAAKALQEHFRDSYLYGAGPSHWEQFADAFRPPSQRKQNGKHPAHPGWKIPTPESVALDFLAKTTPLKPGYITKLLSNARTATKRKKPATETK